MAIWELHEREQLSAHSHPLLAALIFALDKRLQRHHGVFEYSCHPECIFRIQISRCRGNGLLRDGTRLRRGDRVVRLHFWNELVPSTRHYANCVDWAREACWRVQWSLFELAAYVEDHHDFDGVTAISGDVALAAREQSARVSRILERYGFETLDEANPLPLRGRLGRFGENILISLMVFAQNSDTLRKDTLRRGRVPVYLSRRELRRRFGRAAFRPAGRRGHRD